MADVVPREENKRPEVPPKPRHLVRPFRRSAPVESDFTEAPVRHTPPPETPTGISYLEIDPATSRDYQILAHDQVDDRTPTRQLYSQLSPESTGPSIGQENYLNVSELSQHVPQIRPKDDQPTYENEDGDVRTPEPPSPGEYEDVTTERSPLMMLQGNQGQGQGHEEPDYAEKGARDGEMTETSSLYENVDSLRRNGTESGVDACGCLIAIN